MSTKSVKRKGIEKIIISTWIHDDLVDANCTLNLIQFISIFKLQCQLAKPNHFHYENMIIFANFCICSKHNIEKSNREAKRSNRGNYVWLILCAERVTSAQMGFSNIFIDVCQEKRNFLHSVFTFCSLFRLVCKFFVDARAAIYVSAHAFARFFRRNNRRNIFNMTSSVSWFLLIHSRLVSVIDVKKKPLKLSIEKTNNKLQTDFSQMNIVSMIRKPKRAKETKNGQRSMHRSKRRLLVPISGDNLSKI